MFNPEAAPSDDAYLAVDDGDDASKDFLTLIATAFGFMVGALVLLVVAALLWLLSQTMAWPHDDGRYANSPLKPWFDHLRSAKGLCCSFADGVSISDVDWDTGGENKDTQSEGGHYRVRINGQWVLAPDAAVVKEPNKFGPAVVWPYQDNEGTTQIRCFIPGAGT